MTAATPNEMRGTCYVVMGFGKKTDYMTSRTLDLDKTYKNIIKPAVEAAGLKCIRADEVMYTGLIDAPQYEQLLSADVVVADLSTSNANALYQLGVRHALCPYTTLVIAEDGFRIFPFDINMTPVRQYHHMGDGIDFGEVMRFREVLTEAIVGLMTGPRQTDSPVYVSLPGLVPPALSGQEPRAVPAAGDSPAKDAAPDLDPTHSLLMQQADEAQKRGDFQTAKSLFSLVRGMMKARAAEQPEDPYIIQRLALVTYKNRRQPVLERLGEARDLLETLYPRTSNDTETLGLWGAVHKNLWNETKDRKYLDESIRAYERGFYLRNDYYNGINFAYMLNERAAHTKDRAEAVADYVQARRVREQVIDICDEWLASNPAPPESASKEAKELYLDSKYWVYATKAEAYLGAGKAAEADAIYQEAYSFAPEAWMQGSTEEQRAKLMGLLDESPLKYVRADGE